MRFKNEDPALPDICDLLGKFGIGSGETAYKDTNLETLSFLFNCIGFSAVANFHLKIILY